MKASPMAGMLVALSLLGSSGRLGGQERPNAGPWREWSILCTDDDVTALALAFSPTSMLVATSQDQGKIRLWNALTGRQEGLIECPESISILALHFNRTGERLHVATDSGLQIWEVASRKRIKEWAWPERNTVVAFGAAGEKVALAAPEGAVEIWSTFAGKRLSRWEADEATSWHTVAFSNDGISVAAGGTDGQIVLFSETGKTTLQKAGGAPIRRLEFSVSATRLASVRGREGVILWDVAAGKPFKKLAAATPPYHALTFASGPEGDVLGAGCGNGAVELWDVASGQEIATLRGHAGMISALVFAPDGRMLASRSSWRPRSWMP
jgi:WD40 repeat protein